MNAWRILPVVLAVGLTVVAPATRALAVEVAEIRTVPAVEGVALIVDGQRVVTGSRGRAPAVVADVDTAEIRGATRYTKAGPGVRARIGGVERSGARLIVRLDLEYSVRFSFATVDGERIRNDAIERIDLRSSTGKVERLAPTKAVWLQGLRVARLDGAPTPKEIWWNIDDVRVRGTTVVNRSQQRFEPSNMPAGDRTVDVELLYFDASVRVRDAFFGTPVGGELVMERPDGSVERHALDADGAVELGDVPRGQYHMAVDGPGLRIARPITITRDVDDELRFYSWLDVGVFAAFIALFLWGLVAIGARRRGAHDDPPDAIDDETSGATTTVTAADTGARPAAATGDTAAGTTDDPAPDTTHDAAHDTGDDAPTTADDQMPDTTDGAARDTSDDQVPDTTHEAAHDASDDAPTTTDDTAPDTTDDAEPTSSHHESDDAEPTSSHHESDDGRSRDDEDQWLGVEKTS